MFELAELLYDNDDCGGAVFVAGRLDGTCVVACVAMRLTYGASGPIETPYIQSIYQTYDDYGVWATNPRITDCSTVDEQAILDAADTCDPSEARSFELHMREVSDYRCYVGACESAARVYERY